jgi:hypothetical protein
MPSSWQWDLPAGSAIFYCSKCSLPANLLLSACASSQSLPGGALMKFSSRKQTELRCRGCWLLACPVGVHPIRHVEASVSLEVLAGVEHHACRRRVADLDGVIGVAVQFDDHAGAGSARGASHQLLKAAGVERQAPRGCVDGTRTLGDEDVRRAGDPSIVGRQVHVKDCEADQVGPATSREKDSSSQLRRRHTAQLVSRSGIIGGPLSGLK